MAAASSSSSATGAADVDRLGLLPKAARFLAWLRRRAADMDLWRLLLCQVYLEPLYERATRRPWAERVGPDGFPSAEEMRLYVLRTVTEDELTRRLTGSYPTERGGRGVDGGSYQERLRRMQEEHERRMEVLRLVADEQRARWRLEDDERSERHRMALEAIRRRPPVRRATPVAPPRASPTESVRRLVAAEQSRRWRIDSDEEAARFRVVDREFRARIWLPRAGKGGPDATPADPAPSGTADHRDAADGPPPRKKRAAAAVLGDAMRPYERRTYAVSEADQAADIAALCGLFDMPASEWPSSPAPMAPPERVRLNPKRQYGPSELLRGAGWSGPVGHNPALIARVADWLAVRSGQAPSGPGRHGAAFAVWTVRAAQALRGVWDDAELCADLLRVLTPVVPR